MRGEAETTGAIHAVGGLESEDTSPKSPYRCECEEALIGVSGSAPITGSLFQHVHHSPQRRRSLFALGPYTLQSHSIPQVIGTAPSGSHAHPADQHDRYFRLEDGKTPAKGRDIGR